MLGLAGTRDKEPEIAAGRAGAAARRRGRPICSSSSRRRRAGRSPPSRRRSKAEIDDGLARRFRTACQGDEALWERVRPFAGLVRLDTFGYPVVIPKGSVFVTAGTDRRSSGTHYTPRSLTEPIVQYTLEPLVYVGPAEGKPKDQWTLKSARELLDLKICDMACGSGAFLVQACRYLAERLLEAWEEAEAGATPATPGDHARGASRPAAWPTEQLIPDEPAERLTYARRIIAQRCLYGVDKNPLAVEMAKLSLWLLTLAKDKPFTFLDHAIRCGDSLVGIHSLDQLRHFSLKPDADDAVLFRGPLDRRRGRGDRPAAQARRDARQLDRGCRAAGGVAEEADEKIARLRCAADLLVAAEFWGENAKDKLERVRHAAVVSGHYVEKGPTEEFEEKAAKERRGQTMFHWPLEFPEVFVKRGGFDAFVGNPPFMGGQNITGTHGEHLPRLFRQVDLSKDNEGSADLCAYFFFEPSVSCCDRGSIRLLATNTIAQGDTREVGLDNLMADGCIISRAVPSRKVAWRLPPSSCTCHAYQQGSWHGSFMLGRMPVDRHYQLILDVATDPSERHHCLACQLRTAFNGSTFYGRASF